MDVEAAPVGVQKRTVSHFKGLTNFSNSSDDSGQL